MFVQQTTTIGGRLAGGWFLGFLGALGFTGFLGFLGFTEHVRFSVRRFLLGLSGRVRVDRARTNRADTLLGMNTGSNNVRAVRVPSLALKPSVDGREEVTFCRVDCGIPEGRAVLCDRQASRIGTH